MPMITASFASQYIRNYTEDTPVSNRTIRAFVDGNHKPLVFTHGTDEQLYVIVQRDGIPGGWRQVNLTASLRPGGALTAYDVYQDPKSQSIRLCAGLKTGTGESVLYVTGLLNAASFWEAGFSAEGLWQQIGAPSRNETIDHILVDAREGFITTHQPGQDARYYRIDEAHRRTVYELAENVDQIQEIKLGRWKGLPGLFFLSMVGSQQTVSFYGFPEPEFPDDVFTVRFRHPGSGKIDGIALVDGNGPDHELYMIGEDGLFSFHSAPGGAVETVILESKSGIPLRNLQFSQQDGALSCWFVDGSPGKLLYYTYNDPASGKWSVPLALKPDIEQYACVRSTGIRNHLFYVDNKGGLYHFFEDEISSLWHENFVPLAGTGTFKEAAGYLTEVRFAGQDLSSPGLQDAVITLTSPVNLYISVDNAFYQIGPDRPVTIPWNGRESLYIAHTLNAGFVDAVLCLRAGFLNEPLAIDMAKSIYDKIKYLADHDLQGIEKYTRRDGSPLLPDEYRNKEDARKNIAAALRFLVDFRNDCRNNNICGVGLRSVAVDASAGMFMETMTLSLSGLTKGAAAGGVAGAMAFMGGALLIPKDPVSEGVLLAGTLICGLIGAIIGGAIGWTLEVVRKKDPVDRDKPEEPPKKCPGLIFTRIGCAGTLTLYSDHCAKAQADDLNVTHMFSSINMLLTFVGITPSDLPDWPTDNQDCVYHGYLT